MHKIGVLSKCGVVKGHDDCTATSGEVALPVEGEFECFNLNKDEGDSMSGGGTKLHF